MRLDFLRHHPAENVAPRIVSGNGHARAISGGSQRIAIALARFQRRQQIDARIPFERRGDRQSFRLSKWIHLAAAKAKPLGATARAACASNAAQSSINRS